MSSQQVSAAVAAATGGQRLQALPLRRLPSTTISSIRWRLHKASRLQPGVVQAFGRDASRPGRPELLSPSWAGRPVTYSDDGNDDDDDDDDGHSSGHDGELASSGLRRRGLSDDDDHDDEDGDRGHSGRGARASGRRRRPRSQSARRSASAFSNSVSTGLIGPIRADTFDLGDSDEEAGGKSARLGQRRKRIPWDALSTQRLVYSVIVGATASEEARRRGGLPWGLITTLVGQLSVAACQRRMISLRTGNPQLEGFIRDRQRIRRNLWTAQYGPRGTQLHESHELWISRDIMSEEELLSEVDRWPPIEEHYLRSLAEGDGGPASMDVDMSTAASADAPAAEVATFTPGRHNLPGYKPLPRLLRNHADFVHTYRPVRTASSRPPFESSMQGTARLSRLVQRNMWTSFGLAAGVTPPSRRAASAQDTRASLMPGLGPGCGPDALTLPRWVVAGPLRNPHLQGANGSSGGAGGAASADRHAEHNAWQVRGALSASLQDRRHYLSGNYIRSNHQPAAGSPNPLLALEDSCTTAPGTGRTLWDMASTGWQPPTTGPVTPTGPIVACDHLLAFPPTSEADRAEHFFQALNLIKSVLLQPGKSVDPLIIYLLARQLPTTAFEAAFSSSEKLGMIQLAAPSVIVAPSAGSAAMANAPAATAPTATSDSMTVESPAPVATPASVASPLSPVAPAGSVSPSATGAPASALCSTATHPAAASGAASASGNASSGAPAPREALATVSTPARPLNVTERFLAALFGTSSALSNASGSSQDGAVAALLAGATACHAALTRDLAPAESLFDDVASASATETTTSHEDEETPAFTLPMVWHGGAVACILGLRHTGRISILPQFDHFPLGLGADRSHAPHGAGGSLAGATGPASTSGGSSLNGGDVQSPGAGGDLASGPQSPSAASVAGEQNDGLDSLRQLAFAHGRYGRSGVSLLESLQLVVQPAWANSALAGQHGQDPRQPTAAPAQRTPRSLQLTSLLESPSCPAAGPGATATSVATVPARRVPPGQEEPSSDPHALAEPLRSATLLGPRPAIPLAPHATGLDPSTVPGSERWAPALHQWLLSLGWHASLRADEALGLGAGAHGVGFSQEVALLPHTLLFASIWRAGSAGVRESIVARDPALAAFSFEHIHLALAHLVGFGLVIREGHVKTTLLASPFFLEQMDRSRVRLPRRPWSDLAAGYNRQLFDSFQHALIRQMVLTGGVADEPTLLAAMAELVSMGDLRDLLDHLICLRVLLPDLAVALAQPGSFADTVISMEESTGQATITTAGAFLRCHLGINAAPFDHYGGLGLSPAEEQAGRLPSREDPPSRRSAHTAIRVRRSFRLSPVWFERANHSISATEFLNLRGDQSQPHFPPVGTAATIARDTETVAQSAG
ncbi:hypothetical protein H696_03992 [Fonticula alba]|uniref:Uncharacterized protein n=1 Tax=Fonticula alba TaxID=691883 RepID=A0A058Z5P4_FONAL|nr:hypothetical protein H696_03992 [Fonticula alba]KCV69570.1 hypothetical protein H696_03992 [Fonticula alba]|eukprot:XP_009496135.1 hypothetical protein H696_03992 [Fonticula alba]